MIRPAIFLMLLLLLSRGSVAQTEWHFTYWMPYDNNLDGWADSINHMLVKEMPATVSASIQVDRAGGGGMQRLRFENGQIIHGDTVDSDKSHSGSAFQEYLGWVVDTFDYKRHALIFLDHGGKLDEVGLDEYPQQAFLRVDSIRMAMEKELKEEGPVDLLYLQVCAKGSIEPVFEIKDQADYILVSQNKLGAPNFYYQGLMKSMQKKMPDSGAALARIIVNHEREDMYFSQTLVDTKAFGAFTTAWGGMISRLKKDSRAWKSNGMKIILYDEVLYWDLERFVSGFQVARGDRAFQSVVKTIDELIVFHHVNPANDMMKMYCGLSMMAMTTRYDEALKRYGRLKFFQTFDMQGLYEAFEKGRKKPER